MKLRVEISPGEEEEIVIRCKEKNEKILNLESMINNVLNIGSEIEVTLGDEKYYIPESKILFFESDSKRTVAHTADAMYYTDYKLFELEKILPPNFIRCSKSAIINSLEVSFINKNITGASEVKFKNSYKRVYVSRKYIKAFCERVKNIHTM